MTDSKTWPTLAFIHSCRLCVFPASSTYLSLRAITSMQVTMTTGSESHAPQPPIASTTRRMRSASRTVFGIPDASSIAHPHQPQRELREGHHQDQSDELQDHERDDPLVDALDPDLLRCDALDVEEREAEGR